MKFSAKIFILSFALFGFQHIYSQNNIVDEIVWVVGDEAILKSEVEESRREMLLNNSRIDGDPYCFIPEQLAVNKLFLHQAKLDSIEISDVNVSRMVEYYVNETIERAGSVEKLEEYYGKKIRTIREDMRSQLVESELIKGVQNKLIGDITLAPSEIRKFFQSIPQDSLPFIPTAVEVQIITIEPNIPLKEIDAVKARLRDYTDRINSGETEFSTLALLYSEDGASMKGGELGFMGRAMLAPEFANVAFTLNDPSKVSNIVETEFGYHIIQLVERRGDQGNFRHILLKPKIPQEELDKAINRLDSIQKDIVKGEIKFEDAATFISADKDTRNNKGIMVNMSQESNYGGTPRFEMNELNQDIARQVGEMKPGEVSKPFIMRNSKEKQVAAIVKLTTRIDGHKANMNNDYQTIKMMAENKKRQELLDKWLKNKIKSTYVRIDDNWKKCEFRYEGWVK
ncbi:MAG: peptidylprolyl isomerase [Dysgonamonadaceae bacterium]|nr:peptidylprolyl isomerase [Dysgonamonadaceae bacterium]MDD4728908.1 peptidylprolyl isomerase [Dysgonamonadaceae bacterium]